MPLYDSEWRGRIRVSVEDLLLPDKSRFYIHNHAFCHVVQLWIPRRQKRSSAAWRLLMLLGHTRRFGRLRFASRDESYESDGILELGRDCDFVWTGRLATDQLR